MPELSIRGVTDGDREALIRLWHDSGVQRPWNDPDRDIAFARRHPHSTILVGSLNDHVVASAMVGEDGHRGWIYYLAVAPGHRRRGYATAMMRAAEEWLRSRGVWKMQLLVRSGNTDAVAFYGTLGFADVNTTCMQKVLDPTDGGEHAAGGSEA